MTGGGCDLLLISGSLRSGSTNTATLRTAASLMPPSASATIYGELGDLPHFNPDATRLRRSGRHDHGSDDPRSSRRRSGCTRVPRERHPLGR